MALLIDVVTLFPGFFDGPFQESILKRAQQKSQVKLAVHNLRDYTHDRHKTVDAKPFGGGAGMLIKPEPVFECIEAIRQKGWVVLLDPSGEPLRQPLAKKLAAKKHLILIAGHYEGIDQRVREHLVDQEISVGDFVTMGGEAPALCLIEAVVRLVPGVLGNADSIADESFQADRLEYPQYTRPQVFRGWKVPDILMSGHHAEVKKWREEMSLRVTRKKRPDLIQNLPAPAPKAKKKRKS